MIAIDDSLQRAEDWLLAAQSPNGSWRDFWTPSGMSDEWVTGYIGASLASARSSAPQAGALAAWRYLAEKQRGDGGWGYSAPVPSDADSTAWGLILAERIGEENSPYARSARRFLERAHAAGGIVTYADVSQIRTYIEAPSFADLSGWARPHACVTAAAAQLSGLRARLFDTVLAAQRPDGSWESYWWFEAAYATALSVTAIAQQPASQAQAAVERAGKWARQRMTGEHELTPFTLSLLLLILRHDAEAATHALRCTNAIVASQKSDGGWRGSACLRIPRPETADPASVASWQRWWGSGDPFNIFSVDHRCGFTTATAYAAIQSIVRPVTSDAAVL